MAEQEAKKQQEAPVTKSRQVQSRRQPKRAKQQKTSEASSKHKQTRQAKPKQSAKSATTPSKPVEAQKKATAPKPTPKQAPKPKVHNYAFIDGQNLNFGVRSLGWKLDHKKFREYLLSEFEVTKAYIFLGFMEEHQDLYNALQEAGFIIVFKPLVRYDDGQIKGNVDADMVLQVMVDIQRYDQAVIITGDGDFAGLIRHLDAEKKLRRVIIPNKHKYSSLFDRREGEDNKLFTFMDDLRSRLAYKDKKHRKPSRP